MKSLRQKAPRDDKWFLAEKMLENHMAPTGRYKSMCMLLSLSL
jgi:hypothetical protein